MRCVLGVVIVGAALYGASQSANAAQPRWRDPFARLAGPAPIAASEEAAREATKAPELRAILFDHAKSLVNIDGHVIALGDSIGGMKLVQVDERSVTLARAGKRLTLTLTKDIQR